MNDRNSDLFKANGRIVIVGASLAGLRGAEACERPVIADSTRGLA